MSDPSWTTSDVEEVAQSTMTGTIPRLELMQRIGPFPPQAFSEAVLTRVRELVLEQDAREREARA